MLCLERLLSCSSCLLLKWPQLAPAGLEHLPHPRASSRPHKRQRVRLGREDVGIQRQARPPLLPALCAALEGLGALARGLPLAPRDVHAQLLARCRLIGMKGLLGMALGGLDMAVWDAWARLRQQPLAVALGGQLRGLADSLAIHLPQCGAAELAGQLLRRQQGH